jgi:hypothetical protein
MSHNSRNQCFTYFFSLLIPVEGSGSVQNNDGARSGRPKSIQIRIHNTALNFTVPQLDLKSDLFVVVGSFSFTSIIILSSFYIDK